ncbi:MAG: 50S ribosomal protein L25 [Pelagibacteraceae bacterium TMED246]|nr:MAG: 50S ribosomal protein L25 [Pelagibacteraceae bacterium TMED246]|tara:strand:+ start:11968 stop:12618 length:651 start_codon:yes stop_codon:yes gene_type:complete
MKGHKIEVNKRELSSKKSYVKNLRNMDEIPGIYYSHDSIDSIPFSVSKKVINDALKSDSQVYQISVGSKNRDVIIKSVQYHPITEQMLHIDLYGVRMDQVVTVKVPIEIIGQSEGVKAGGVLNQTITELDITCLPGNIPQNIEIDITDLNIGDSIRFGQLSLSEGITVEGDEENLIIAVNEPVQETEETEEELMDDTASTSSETDDSSDNQEEQTE